MVSAGDEKAGSIACDTVRLVVALVRGILVPRGHSGQSARPSGLVLEFGVSRLDQDVRSGFSPKSVVAAVLVSSMADLPVFGEPAFVLVPQENGEMGIGRGLCVRSTEKHGHPMDASFIVVVSAEMVPVSIRHVLLSLGYCMSARLVRRHAKLVKTHSCMGWPGVLGCQAGVLCGGGIRVDSTGREFRHVFRQKHVLHYAMFVGSCLAMRAKRKVAGMADGDKLRPLCGASILYTFFG